MYDPCWVSGNEDLLAVLLMLVSMVAIGLSLTLFDGERRRKRLAEQLWAARYDLRIARQRSAEIFRIADGSPWTDDRPAA